MEKNMKNEMHEQIVDKSSKTVLDRITIICTVLTIIISSIILAGWLFNLFDITRSNPIYNPMSPGSSLSFIVSGVALLVYFYLPVNHTARKLAKIAVALILAFDLIILIDFIIGQGFDIERVILPHPEIVNKVFVGWMSPLTAASFVISSLALFLLLFSPDGKKQTKGTAAYLASVSLYIGFIVFIGYLYGTPLFYGGTTIPTSLSTAICFQFFSVGIITAAGREYLPLRLFIGDSVRARLMRAFIPVILAYIVLEGFLKIVLLPYSDENVIHTSMMVIFFFIFGGLITSRIAQTVGGNVDRKNLIQREGAADALCESESKFRAIFETVPEGLGLIRLKDDLLIEANNGILQMFGYAKDELIGKNIREQNIWFDPDDKNKMLEQLQSSNFAYGMEVKYRKKNGEISIGTYSAAKLMINNEPHLIISTRDISRRKRAENEREVAIINTQNEKNKSEAIIAALGDGIIIQDTNYIITYQNKSQTAIYGEHAGEHCYKVYENRDNICEDCPIEKTFLDGKIHRTERSVQIGGKMSYYELTSSPLRDASGKIIAGVKMVRDITDRKIAEEKIREGEQFLESIIESIQDAIGIIDTEMNIIKVNKTCESWYPHAVPLIGKKCYEAYHNRKERCELCPALETFRTGKSAYKVVPKHGPGGIEVGWLEIYSYPLRDTAIGQMKGVIEYVRDITQSKEAQRELRKSEERFRKLIETEPECVKLLTEDNILIDMNPAGLGMIEADSLVQVAGKSVMGLIDPEYKEAFADVGRSVFKGESASLEFSITGLKGTKRWLETHAVPLRDDNGKINFLLAVTCDVTERKRAQEERIHLMERDHEARAEVEAARKLDRMKSMFIASTSHELRTPLNSVIGFSSLLLEGFSGPLNPDQKEQLEIVHSSGKHLLTLINDIIDISKIEAGNITVEVSEFKLRPIVDEAVSMLRVSLSEKNLDLKVNMQDIVIKSDRRRIFQCIVNLISNAIKYTEKGSVEITVKVINNNVNISIADTGIGIKTEDIPKLFAPFVRLQSQLTYKTSGTGLGLYLVKKIAKDFLGGDVEVNSEFGKGSTFTLRVPVDLEGKV